MSVAALRVPALSALPSPLHMSGIPNLPEHFADSHMSVCLISACHNCPPAVLFVQSHLAAYGFY